MSSPRAALERLMRLGEAFDLEFRGSFYLPAWRDARLQIGCSLYPCPPAIVRRNRIEAILHEVCHSLYLDAPLTTSAMDARIQAMAPDEADLDEVRTLAVELLLARDLGVPLCPRRLATFALKNMHGYCRGMARRAFVRHLHEQQATALVLAAATRGRALLGLTP